MTTRGRYWLFVVGLIVGGCRGNGTLFESLPPEETGVTFANTLTETEEANILAYEYFYNGGGVATGDFNNDGRIDLYFTGNQVENKLYLNRTESSRSSLRFEDVTTSARVGGRPLSWKTGVAVADVNGDGWLDLYVCYSGKGRPESRRNQLFINQGVRQEGGNPTFVEVAEPYGLADVGYSTHATFFDYDSDGDLDVFVLNHNLKGYQRKEAAIMKAAVDPYAGDRLYRNEWPKPIFTDVTQQAGIKSNPLGFGLGVTVADFNGDNRPDVYVANDYVEEDYLYLNNGNGGNGTVTFSERGKEAMGHFSYSAMGVDAADINNDARPDLFTCDMLPEDNRRQKLLAFPDNWNVQQSMLSNGFHWQNMRNMLQINLGEERKEKGERSSATSRSSSSVSLVPTFSELGQLAGVSRTDWSWGPLFADFDNDGQKDLFVSNGFVKDLSDLDFVKFQVGPGQVGPRQADEASSQPLLEQLKRMPSTPTHHYAFRNNGNDSVAPLPFTNVVNEWGFADNTIACGSAYADLDNDGDLDLITNNTNSPARIYRNRQQQTKPQTYLRIQVRGAGANPQAVGARVWVYAKGGVQYVENQPTHGFQSSMAGPMHIGLGLLKAVDSVRVQWPDGRSRLVLAPTLNTTLTIDYLDNAPIANAGFMSAKAYIEPTVGLDFTHRENFNIDFNRQILLPKLYSRNGPKMAVGDVNGDSLDDLYLCGAQGQAGQVFIQQTGGLFTASVQPALVADSTAEDCDALFFDADGDRDLDLYVVSGGYEQFPDIPALNDRLYLNNGRGRYTKAPLPPMASNKSCVKPLDFDRDGDLDLFVGGSVKCGLFPYSSESFLLQNDGHGHFTITKKLDLGLVTDAAIVDLDQDHFPELIVTAEWQPIRVLFSKLFQEDPAATLTDFSRHNDRLPNLAELRGWWNRVQAADLDKDGDLDFVLGNVGQNNPFGASPDRPVTLYFGDFDRNGSVDFYMTHSFSDGVFPVYGRDEALEQLVHLRKKFTDYKSYSVATIDDVFDKETIKRAEKLLMTEPRSGLLINENGQLRWQPLPLWAQVAPTHAIDVADVNRDGHPDILLGGNDATYRIRIGKMDANRGILLLGNGHNEFRSVSSGLNWTGDVRDIRRVRTATGFEWIVTQNNGPVLLYKQIMGH